MKSLTEKLIFVFLCLFVLGCAKLSVETAKPIKLDISMRIDVYQHVEKDISSIEDQIYGGKDKKLNAVFGFGIEAAYAADFSFAVLDAIERRKSRSAMIEEYFSQGYIGENRDAVLEIVNKGLAIDLKGKVIAAIDAENADRVTIYSGIAQKNGADLADVRKSSFSDHYRRAGEGYWFEVYDDGSGKYSWKQK
jgi:uncharacterized protein YdbL (DUF1318 family)